MEKIRRAPEVNQFTTSVDAQAVFLAEKVLLLAIASIKGLGDFQIGADGIATEQGEVIAENHPHVFRHGPRRYGD